MQWRGLLMRVPEGADPDRLQSGFDPAPFGDPAEVSALLAAALPLAEHGPGFCRVKNRDELAAVLFFEKEREVDVIGVQCKDAEPHPAVRAAARALGAGIYDAATGLFALPEPAN